ncbi:pyruvate synthase subunit porA [Clostridium argentinense CDC 2741]|uniref:Pyruvate synthase subunit porA n=1 Tax=Clostridium argentinense CDC 2741 TaxID=1418104 RepID=A0A0C1U1I3_9CLOT|nr:transketolase C-terminal domain-containing protein [Clostridium argentinense]ARC86518.1 pyruvate ferredoxin oxidoreductase [Clostridium argentinense]KIE46784.1 pyruvate synthase subunit porA [Clostridium argentinense CDC 2741]NFF37983.1 pyruvate ferredoxin oxidoreductase [Clostridium argentinense]NFP49965.1 pyruvate ferredoxin oxidoreductase [Clostridium argentinense]NFP71375.1 pyruvate ferredoxin oxidoreductase [Clostridium argentinense]
MAERKAFLSGNDALAEGVRLARPQVISAYPITPQTTVVERLSEMVEEGSLKSEYIHVESEHSALSAAMGASSVGARTFTATSSQGLLYMAECLQYASGGRFPIVMMNANRSTALPWNIYGDQRDSLSQLDCGWIQVYVEDAQESLDMVLQSYVIAENKKVLTPIMINLDGFILTHTYELVQIPTSEEADKFVPPFETPNKMDLENPVNMAFSTGPGDNMEFKYQQHKAMIDAKKVIKDVDEAFNKQFGRKYGGMVEEYRCDDAEIVLVTLGSVTGLARIVVDELRASGLKAGVFRIRFLRPFPEEELINLAKHVKGIGVLEKDISFGYEGTVYANVNSAIAKARVSIPSYNFVAGLGGRDISKDDVLEMFQYIKEGVEGTKKDFVKFIGLGVEIND